MKLQDPVYYCFVNNILKHEGDILHICDDIISVEINCFRRVNKGFPVAYFYFICLTTHVRRAYEYHCWFVSLTLWKHMFFIVFNSL